MAITDNADPMNVVVFRRRARLRRGRRRVVCRVPVFRKGASATENSLIVVGRSLIVENNYGYVLGVIAGGWLAGHRPRSVKRRGRGCRLKLWNQPDGARAPPRPKLSLAMGLVYLYTKDRAPGNQDSGSGPRWTSAPARSS